MTTGAISVNLEPEAVARIRIIRARSWQEAMSLRALASMEEARAKQSRTTKARAYYFSEAACLNARANELIKDVQALNDCLPEFPTAESDVDQLKGAALDWSKP